jgi:hypothetical protein
MIVPVQHYVGLLAGLGGVIAAAAAVAGGIASSDEYSSHAAGKGATVRSRLAKRYKAHPRAMSLQLACLAVAAVLELAALVTLFA